MSIVKLIGIAILGVIIVSLLRSSKPEFATLATIATGVVMLIVLVNSLSSVIVAFQGIIDKSGLTYQFSAMSTTIEGEWDDVMKVVGDCFKALAKDCDRISVMTRVDYRASNQSRLKSKVQSVEEKLGRDLVKKK